MPLCPMLQQLTLLPGRTGGTASNNLRLLQGAAPAVAREVGQIGKKYGICADGHARPELSTKKR